MLQKRIQKVQELLCNANVIRNPERIVGVHEQIQQSEQRLSGIIQEKVALENGMFMEGEIASALTSFAPVWDSLTPHEQSKLISLLIERVGFDGNDGSVSVQFRSLQLQQLCNGGSHV